MLYSLCYGIKGVTVGVINTVGVSVGVFVGTSDGVAVGIGALVGVVIPVGLNVRLITCPGFPNFPRSCPLKMI